MNIEIILDPLSERKQVGILYHFRGWNGTLNIIKTGKITSGVFDAISFTRNYQMGTMVKSYGIQEKQIRLVVDGNRLSDKYKIRPYQNIEDDQIQRKYYSGTDLWPIHSEAEERIELPLGESIDIRPYLIQIDFLDALLKKNGKNEERIQTLQELYMPNIPFNIVDKFLPVKY